MDEKMKQELRAQAVTFVWVLLVILAGGVLIWGHVLDDAAWRSGAQAETP